MTETARQIWNDFCAAHRIAVESVPLFACDVSGFVELKKIGKKTAKRTVLVRHQEMERLILRETDILKKDWDQKTHEYDGLIYMMHRRGENDSVVPLYIGHTQTFGKGKQNLSANIGNLHKRKNFFARWGDNYAYHIGDLSAATLTDHPLEKKTPKYIDWATMIFKNTPTERPQLAFNVYFWAKAWRSTDVGIWSQLSPTRLGFLEYLLIGVASTAFGGSLLNQEGSNSGLRPTATT